MINPNDLDFFIKNNMNVLLIGESGIGKTTIIKNLWEKYNIKSKYFNGPTLDPWIDFIGIPKEQKDEKGSYIEVIPPRQFRDDEVEAIFIDEINRAPKQVRNAIMELTLFRSINGRKFNNLRFIWAAMNPETEENTYDVERIDRALKDRFPVHINMDYKCDNEYFTEKFGANVARHAVSWWNTLPKEIKLEVSPRRLDYALEAYEKGGPGMFHYIIPSCANVTKLIQSLTNGVPLDRLKELAAKKDIRTMTTFLANINNYDDCKDWIVQSKENVEAVIDAVHPERIVELITKNIDNAISANIVSAYHSSAKVEEACDLILKNRSENPEAARKITQSIPLPQSANWSKEVMLDKTIGNQVGSPDYSATLVKWRDLTVKKNVKPSVYFSTIRKGLADSLPDPVVKETLESLIMSIKFYFPNIVEASKEDAFTSLNYCLSRLNKNITVEQERVIFNCKAIKNGWEKYIWTPNCNA